VISLLAGDARMAGEALSWLGSGLTTAFVIFFGAWTFWAWRPANRARMEQFAQIPFDDGER
jgi:cbb3-type cytochrome oxidase subunit 3